MPGRITERKLFKRLIKDYVIILYSEMNGNKINMKKALIPNFKIVIERENGEIEEILIVKNLLLG